jgi:hypothetical protein
VLFFFAAGDKRLAGESRCWLRRLIGESEKGGRRGRRPRRPEKERASAMASFSAARKQGQASVPFKPPSKSGNSIKKRPSPKKGKNYFQTVAKETLFLYKRKYFQRG